MTTIIKWRDWHPPAVVVALTAFGTLPLYETHLTDTDHIDIWSGEEIAEAVAMDDYEVDPSGWQKGREIVILEPAGYAGHYVIEIDWDPKFYAFKQLPKAETLNKRDGESFVKGVVEVSPNVFFVTVP